MNRNAFKSIHLHRVTIGVKRKIDPTAPYYHYGAVSYAQTLPKGALKTENTDNMCIWNDLKTSRQLRHSANTAQLDRFESASIHANCAIMIIWRGWIHLIAFRFTPIPE